jgi:hypothetical protein
MESGARPPVRIFGDQFVIRQKDKGLELVRPFGSGSLTMQLRLDGTETRSRRPGRLCEADSEVMHVAKWEGASLRVTMTGAVPAGGGTPIKRETSWTLRLESPDVLRVEALVPSSARATAATAQAPATAYRRTGPPSAAITDANTQRAPATMAQAAWIAGDWQGSAGTTSFEERWTPPAGGSMLAVARTIRDGVMIAFEFLCIVERDGGLVYTAMPNGRQPATDFVLTHLEGETLVFENPAHDFPKKIRYTRKADGSLEATISGDGPQKPQTFVFTRK